MRDVVLIEEFNVRPSKRPNEIHIVVRRLGSRQVRYKCGNIMIDLHSVIKTGDKCNCTKCLSIK